MPPHPTNAHEHAAPAEADARENPVRCAALTVSDTRSRETDRGGDLVCSIAREFGHEVVDRDLVRDDPPAIRARLETWLNDANVEAVLITGGTGIAKRDTTIEVVRDLLSIEVVGFGELFRQLSYAEVGSAAMLSRALGGVVIRPESAGGDTVLFAMPGSVNAVETAMRKLIGPELGHLRWLRGQG